MGKAKKTRKFAVAKKIISPKDTRVKSVASKAKEKQEKERAKKEEPRQVEQAVSALFFQYNEQLGKWFWDSVDWLRQTPIMVASRRLSSKGNVYIMIRMSAVESTARICKHLNQISDRPMTTPLHLLGPPYHVLVDTNFLNFSIRNKLDVIRSMMDCLLAKCIPCITDCVMGELEKLGSKYKVALRLAKDPRFERIPCNCKGCYADDCITQMAKQWRCFIVATCDKELRGRIRKIPGVPCMYISNHKYTVERMPEAFGAPR